MMPRHNAGWPSVLRLARRQLFRSNRSQNWRCYGLGAALPRQGAPRVWSDSPLRREPLVHAYKVVKPSLATRHWRDCAASVARSERHQCAFFSSAPRLPENESLSIEPLARCTAAVPFSIPRAPSAAQLGNLEPVAPAHADRECVPEPVAAGALFGRCNQGAAFAETARACRS